MLAPNAQFWLPFLETPIFFNPLSFKNYLMKIHKFGKKQNTKGQIYRCKKLNQDICYTFLIIHDLKCPRICGHAVFDCIRFAKMINSRYAKLKLKVPPTQIIFLAFLFLLDGT